MSDMDMSGDYADGWRPEEGDLLVGTVVSVDLGNSAYIGQYPIITVQPKGTKDAEDRVAVHGFHATLLARLIALKPVRGEQIAFKFKGKRPHKTDRTREVADYVVKIKGRDADVWGALGAQPIGNMAPPVHPPQPPPVQPQEFDTRTPAGDGTPTADDDDIPF